MTDTEPETTETETTEVVDVVAASDPGVRYVPLKTLWLEHDKWVNPRSIIIESEVQKIAESVADRGVLVPLAVVQVRSPKGDVINLVLDGQQRCLAGKRVLAEDALVPVLDAREGIIEEMTWEVSDQLLAIALDIGIRRTELSSYELSETAERLRNRNRPGTEIARMLNKSESWVSRMCKARLKATAALLARWRRGELTDEQFKDLAEEKDPTEQAAKAKAVVDSRKSGDKGEARMLGKEAAATAKAKAKVAKSEAKAATPPPRGKASKVEDPKSKAKTPEQSELPISQPTPPAPAAPPKAVAMPKAVLEDIVAMAGKRPPVHDYVRGVLDMACAALGVKDMATFAKPWAQYLSRLGGTGGEARKPSKAPKGKKRGGKSRK